MNTEEKKLAGLSLDKNKKSIWDYKCKKINGYDISINGFNKNEFLLVDDKFLVDEETMTLVAYTGNDTEIVIPSGVKKIGPNTFRKKRNIKKIVISEGVDFLGDSAFLGCDSLEEVVLPNGLEIIGSSCFFDCNQLKSINLPNSIKALGAGCFEACKSLQKIKIPNSLSYISSRCFAGCSNLKEIEIPNSITKIYDECFSDCINLSTINLPPSIKAADLRTDGSCIAFFNDIPFELTKFSSISDLIKQLRFSSAMQIDFSACVENYRLVKYCNDVFRNVLMRLESDQINPKIFQKFNRDSFVENMSFFMNNNYAHDVITNIICNNACNLISCSISTALSNYNYLLNQNILDKKTMNMLFFNVNSDMDINEKNINDIFLNYINDYGKLPELLNILLVEPTNKNLLDLRDRMKETEIVNDLQFKELNRRLLIDSRIKLSRSYFETIVEKDKNKLSDKSLFYEKYTGKYHQLNGIMSSLADKMNSFNDKWFDEFYEYVNSNIEYTELYEFMSSLITVNNWDDYNSEKERAEYLKNEIFGKFFYANVYLTLEDNLFKGLDNEIIKYLKFKGISEDKISDYIDGSIPLDNSNEFLEYLKRNTAISDAIKSNIGKVKEMSISNIKEFKEKIFLEYSAFMIDKGKNNLENLLKNSNITFEQTLKFASLRREKLFRDPSIVDFVLEYDPYSFQALKTMPRDSLTENDLEFQTLKRWLSNVTPEKVFKGEKRFLVFSPEDKNLYKKIDSTLDFDSKNDYLEYLVNKVNISKIPEEDVSIYLDRFSKKVVDYVNSCDDKNLLEICNMLDLYLRNKAIYEIQSKDDFYSEDVAKEIFDKDSNYSNSARMIYSLYNLNRLAHFPRTYEIRANSRNKFRFNKSEESASNKHFNEILKTYNDLSLLGFDLRKLNFDGNLSTINAIANSHIRSDYTPRDYMNDCNLQPSSEPAILAHFNDVSRLKSDLSSLLRDDVKNDTSSNKVVQLISNDNVYKKLKNIAALDSKTREEVLNLATEEETFFNCKRIFAEELQKKFVQEISGNNMESLVNATPDDKQAFFQKHGYIVELQKDGSGAPTLVCYCDKFRETFSVHLKESDIPDSILNKIDANQYTLAHCKLNKGLHLNDENSTYNFVSENLRETGFLTPNHGESDEELISRIVDYNASTYCNFTKRRANTLSAPSDEKDSALAGVTDEMLEAYQRAHGVSGSPSGTVDSVFANLTDAEFNAHLEKNGLDSMFEEAEQTSNSTTKSNSGVSKK